MKKLNRFGLEEFVSNVCNKHQIFKTTNHNLISTIEDTSTGVLKTYIAGEDYSNKQIVVAFVYNNNTVTIDSKFNKPQKLAMSTKIKLYNLNKSLEQDFSSFVSSETVCER